MGEGLSYFALGITLSTAIGPYIGLMLSPDYDAVFSIGIGMYTVSTICALLIRVPEETLTEEQKSEAKGFKLNNVLQLSAVPLGIATMVFFFGYSGVLSFIDEYSEAIDMVETAAYFYVAVSAGTLISRLTTGKIFDTKGPNGIITVGILIYAAGTQEEEEAIAVNLRDMMELKVPVVSVVIGEGGSGGAIGIGVCNRLLALSNSYYSVISPEGCSAILFHYAKRAADAAQALRLTARDLKRLGIADEVIEEPIGGAHRDHAKAAAALKEAVLRHLGELSHFSGEELKEQRYRKFREVGSLQEI